MSDSVLTSQLRRIPTAAGWREKLGILGGSAFDTVPEAISALGPSTNLYVATTGSDSNDGLAVGSPFLTIQKAFDTVDTYAPILGGTWTINIAAGTYTEAAVLQVPSKEYIDIKGPTAIAGTPTAIVDGNSQALGTGFSLGPHGRFRVYDIKFQNLSAYGVQGTRHTDIALYNCHATNCGEAGANAEILTRMWVFGGDYSANDKYGVRVYSSSTLELGDDERVGGASCVLDDNTTAGIFVRESSNARLEDFSADGNGTAAVLVEQSRAHLIDCSVSNSTYGVLARRNSSWLADGVTYGSGLTHPFANLSSSIEYDEQSDWGSEYRITYDTSQTSHTGDTNATLLKTLWAVPINWFISAGKKIRVRIYGSATGAGGTKTIAVRFDTNNVAEWTTIATGSVDWLMEVDIWATGSATQSYAWKAFVGTSSIAPVTGTRAIDMTSGRDLRIYGTLVDGADTIAVDRVEAWYVGG